MNNPPTGKRYSTAQQVYSLLLAAYPAEFRREYGREMMQLFQDCCRAEARRNGVLGISMVWGRVFLDLALTAPAEHWQNFKRGANVMKALKTLALAVIVYAAVILIAGKILLGGREYLPYALGALFDSLVSVGIAFNFIVLLLVTTKLLSPVRAVRVAAAGVVLFLAAFLALVPSDARPNWIALTTLVLSLLFWFLTHQLWAHRRQESSIP